MQVFEIAYEPKLSSRGRTGGPLDPIKEYLPLDDNRITPVLRALHPEHRVTGIRPFGKPLKDRGQYTYWHMSFRYDVGPFINIPTDSDADREASKNLCNAERSVNFALTRLGLEYKSTYSWPDGSLCYAIRTTEKSISGLIPKINSEMAKLAEAPRPFRASHTYEKKRTHRRGVYGAFPVTVENVSQIATPFESDPHKAECLNYVEFFESKPYWRRFNKAVMGKDPEDTKNPEHQAFRAGFEEAFGHQRLFHYTVKPSDYVISRDGEPASNEVCAAYVAAYALGKVLLTLALPDGAYQKPWRLLYDEGEKPRRF